MLEKKDNKDLANSMQSVPIKPSVIFWICLQRIRTIKKFQNECAVKFFQKIKYLNLQ